MQNTFIWSGTAGMLRFHLHAPHDGIMTLARIWKGGMRKSDKSSNQILSPNQMLQVRYEDYVGQPETGIRRICEFLGIDFEDAMLDPANFIDYTLHSTLNERIISSSKLNEWSKNKNIPTFKGGRYAWKDCQDFAFSRMPKHILQRLKTLGYDTQCPAFTP